MEVQQKLLPGDFLIHIAGNLGPVKTIFFQAQFLRPKFTFPPPFQWIYYIARFVHDYKKRPKTNFNIEDQARPLHQKEGAKKKLEYLKLLRKLISIKQKNELEKTEKEKLEKLEKDITNTMRLEMQRMKTEIIEGLNIK